MQVNRALGLEVLCSFQSALFNPGVIHQLLGGGSLVWVPPQAVVDELTQFSAAPVILFDLNQLRELGFRTPKLRQRFKVSGWLSVSYK